MDTAQPTTTDPGSGSGFHEGQSVRVLIPGTASATATFLCEDEDHWHLRDALGHWKLSKDTHALLSPDEQPPVEWREAIKLRTAGRSAMLRSAAAERKLSGWTGAEGKLTVPRGTSSKPVNPKSGSGSPKVTGKVYRMKPTDTLNAAGQLVNAHGNVKAVQHLDATVLQLVDGDWTIVRGPVAK